MRDEVGEDTRFEPDSLCRAENGAVVFLYLRPESFDPLLDLEVAVHALPFGGAGVKFQIGVFPLIVDLAENELEQFPKGLWLLQPLVARDVIVAAAESKKQRVAGGGLKLIEPRALGFILVAAKSGKVRDFFDLALAFANHHAVAEALQAIRPHAKFRIWRGREIAFELRDAFLFIGRLHVLFLTFDDQPGVLLLVLGTQRENYEVGTLAGTTELELELYGDVRFRVAVLTDERLCDFLPNVLLGCLISSRSLKFIVGVLRK